MFFLGDQLLVNDRLINAIIKAYAESSKPMVIPVFAGQRGNPVVIGRELFGDLSEATIGDAGVRVMFNRHAYLIRQEEMGSRFIHVDTVEDYNNLVNNI